VTGDRRGDRVIDDTFDRPAPDRPIADFVLRHVHERGPITVAAFMDLALYNPACGYYATSPRRSGRRGDFVTSVDVGSLFGDLLEIQIAEMADMLAEAPAAKAEAFRPDARRQRPAAPDFDLVEAGAGSGTLSSDILRAARQRNPALYARTRLHLVETSPAARAAQRETLGDLAERLASSGDQVPAFDGVLVANELLDALPVHQVVMRESGLKEIYVASRDGQLGTIEGPPSSQALAEYLDRLGVRLEPGWRAEIGLRAVSWVHNAARRLGRGFLIFLDYGHSARELYSVTHSQGTLTTFDRHVASDPALASTPAWLRRPGQQDITAHVDFTSVEQAAHEEGLVTLGFLDQTYFLMGLFQPDLEPGLLATDSDRRAFKTLTMPGGLGSTHKVLVLGKNIGTPRIRGCSFRTRLT